MDNLSHSLAGLAVGELIQRSLPAEAAPAAQALRRRMLLLTCWAGSNFPDLDLVFKGLLPAPLGYLLHHRGHTHTLLATIPQALLLLALLWLLWPAARRLLRASATARTGLFCAAGAGLMLHLLMDYLNSYGIHPFYPFDNRWVYGDMLFILEPVFWVALGAPLAWMVGPRWIRAALLAALVAILLWATASAYLHWPSLAALLLAGAVLAWLQQRSGPAGRAALLAGIGTALLFIGVQHWSSARGKEVLGAHLAQLAPSARLLDVSMTGFPANPLCWMFVAVERDERAASYRIRRGLLTLPPARSCPAGFAESPVTGQRVTISMQHEAPLARLHALAAQCRGYAWLRFARMPLIDAQQASDVRFSMSGGSNFSSYPLQAVDAAPCPANVPPWIPPRLDLLAPP